MMSFKKILPWLLGTVAMATSGILDGIPFLESLVDFFSLGSDAALAFAAVGVAGVTAESANPAGTTTVTSAIVGEGTEDEAAAYANYLDDDLNPTLVKIRPQDTPIDTITRMIGNVEKSEAWEAGGWEIGTREVTDKVTISGNTVTGTGDMWLVGDTFVLTTEDGPVLDNDKQPISALIIGKTGNTLSVQRVGKSTFADMPSVSGEVIALRLSRAVSELTASVTGFALQPTDRKYYNQIHMCQVEESVIHSLHKKKVAMDFTTYKEQTLWDFKRGMEYANLFQVGGLSKDAEGQLVHLATGIWWQMNQEIGINYDKAMEDYDWNEIGKQIFEGNNGSDRRFLLAGPELMLHISNIPSYKKQLEAKNTEVVLGVRVHKIETPFGELLIKPMGTLFEGYFAKCGMVVDVNYLKKFVMEPLTATVLELDKTGQRRVKNAVRMHETYSLFLENLPVHFKLVPVSEQ